MRHHRAFRLSVAAAVVLMIAAGTPAQQPEPEIVVTGIGDLSVPPTVLNLEITVLSIQVTGAVAADQAQARADEIILDFRQFGLQPHDWTQHRAVVRKPLPDEPRKQAFWGMVTLSVRLDDFTSATDMLDRASQLKAVEVQFDFEVDEPAVVYENALKRAIDDARRKAELVARELGVTLGPAVACEELSHPPGHESGRIPGFRRRMGQIEEPVLDDVVPQPDRPMVLKPEDVTVSAVVRARYAIAP